VAPVASRWLAATLGAWGWCAATLAPIQDGSRAALEVRIARDATFGVAHRPQVAFYIFYIYIYIYIIFSQKATME
jgi:hypothetical protein